MTTRVGRRGTGRARLVSDRLRVAELALKLTISGESHYALMLNFPHSIWRQNTQEVGPPQAMRSSCSMVRCTSSFGTRSVPSPAAAPREQCLGGRNVVLGLGEALLERVQFSVRRE